MLRCAGIAPLKGDIFSNNVLSGAARVSEAIIQLTESQGISNERVAIAVPAPSVFTKKIKVPRMSLKELDANIQFEAGNFIPHNINAVRLDYHIVGDGGKNQLDVLVAAVKNEIIDSFLNAVEMAGIGVAIADVDTFAMQNMFEHNYPELTAKTIALVNMGQRYSSINICKGGDSLFCGDVAIGGKVFTDSLAEVFSLSSEDAERLKVLGDKTNPLYDAAVDIMHKNVEQVAAEFNRQLSFFWNASGSDEGIDHIFLTGGGSCAPGLLEELSDKTGIECELMDPFRAIEVPASFDAAYIKSLSPFIGVAVGLALREPGDRMAPSDL